MQGFTYYDYSYYKKIFINNPINAVLKENSEPYTYEEKELHQPHDKIFKEILDNKKEAVSFINEMLNLKNTKYKLKEEDIEKYNRKFVTKDFSNMESDVIYKKINQNIFFLIEHQSTIDFSMPYRILRYNMAIMESAIDTKKVKNKNYKLPTIYSFVIYTGKNKWNATNYLIDKQEKLEGYGIENFANFQVIDINDYTEKELLNSESLLTKMMLLEKAKNYEELENYLQIIINQTTDNQQMIFLQRLIRYVFKDKLDSQKFKKYIQELENKQEKGGDFMFVDILVDKFEEVFELEQKLKKQESQMKKQESQMKKQESQMKKQESQMKKQESQMKEQESKMKKKESKMKEQETKVKEQETKVKEQETKVKEQETKVKEQETKVKEQETKVKEQETKVKEQETKVKERESKVEEKEIKIEQEREKIKEREKAVNIAENQMIIKMLKSNIDESTILKIADIDKNRLTKIKQDNNFVVAN